MTPPINGELTRFSASFPFMPIGAPGEVQELIQQYLPPWDRAAHLCETYLANAGWLFRGVTRQQLVVEMLAERGKIAVAAHLPNKASAGLQCEPDGAGGALLVEHPVQGGV